MLLMLVRHAHAGERDATEWPDDRDRPLTEKGRKMHRRMSRLLGGLDLTPAVILASPWIRAAQTAQILHDTLELEAPVVPCDALATDPDLSALAGAVGDQEPDAIVALVGHSPWMEELAGLLLGGNANSLRIDFPKSGALVIELEHIEAGGGTLRWFLRPRAAR